MKINRVSEESKIPAWTNLDDQKHIEENKKEWEFVTRINLTDSADVNESVLVTECEKIDECVNQKEAYHYNSSWRQSDTHHLREYALASGLLLSNFRPIDPSAVEEEIDTIKAANIRQEMIKTASINNNVAIGDEVGLLKDPFKLDEDNFREKVDPNWEKVSGSLRLEDQPLMNSDVRPIRGGEDYNTNSNINPAINQNSITNPNAIEQYSEQEEEDTGERLRREAKERKESKTDERKEWEINYIKQMGKYKAQGTVFPTEFVHAHSGLNNKASENAHFDPMELPDKTAGELISEHNKVREASIKREKPSNDWEKMSKQKTREISLDFAESLKKAMGK